MVPKLGNETAVKLNELGITEVVHLKDLLEDNVADLHALLIHSLTSLLKSADLSLSSAPPFIITDH